jgi:type I restriction enzyme, S subunit
VKARTVQLAEVMTVDRTAASETECRTLPYVGLEHIEKNTGHFTADFRRKPETLLATKYRFTPRHVLYGKLRPNLNKTTLPDFDGVCTTEILPLLPQPQTLDRGYLYSALLSQGFVKWASNSVSGANLPRLDPERLLEYEIRLKTAVRVARPTPQPGVLALPHCGDFCGESGQIPASLGSNQPRRGEHESHWQIGS